MNEILTDEMFDDAERLLGELGLDPMGVEYRELHGRLAEGLGFSLVQSSVAVGLMRNRAMNAGAPRPREINREVA